MVISTETLLELQNIARLSPKTEACGIVTSDNKVIQITNVSKTPEHTFVFSKREYFTILKSLAKENKTLLCVWHTHPEGFVEPSKADLEFVKLSKRISLIVTATDYRWIKPNA